ncbi:hypothetical protein LOTGIDRAFT_233275 [Lottia gigantea]|uniref:AB hydrolase-1 domain-containing protein n=1 Tax=Lottia gigantea TaxID=225164 RepID=V4A5L7_LOTGI|nr:hypothetical protein LOTGIDRAFT_233275 [Lottia gigantea]ESO91987.1 hypothetical protein LOTGIDRAFT_233275 [Lottia gigantea]
MEKLSTLKPFDEKSKKKDQSLIAAYSETLATVWYTVKVSSLVLFLLYIAIPIFVRANPWILPKVVFSNVIRWPPFIDFKQPSDFGLNVTRNFYLTTDDGVQIGVWHTLPESVAEVYPDTGVPDDKFEHHLSDGKKIIVYLHGNSGTRGGWHRVQLYKLFSSLDFHVVAIDYRGFGDSGGNPTEDGVVSDAYHIYHWVKQRSGDSPVFLWGHSLGTAITTKLARKLCDEDEHPLGVVLEAPFNNINEAAANHPFAFPYKMLPWFSDIFINSIGEHGIFFSTDKSVEHVTSPIMILHAEDDAVVPYHLGMKLFEAAKEIRPDTHGDVEFVTFPGHHGYGHKHIFKAPELPEVIRGFMERSIIKRNEKLKKT